MADRGNVRSVRHGLAVAAVLMGWSAPALGAQTDQPCDVVPMDCTFEALPFEFTVVDAETHRPLADVHALAEWQIHGVGGRPNGPLMVLEAVSGQNGVLNFPGWGPITGPVTGIGIGRDPVITLFKTGYRTLVINNGDPPGTKETQRVRRFGQHGRTYALEPFRGAPPEWLQELERVYAGIAFPRSDDQSLQFRGPYLNRLRRVWAEREKVPEGFRGERDLFWFVEKRMKFLEEGHR